MAVLITGASAGLGEGFARGLAADGRDLILTARREDRLDKLAAELRTTHGITVTVFAADLAMPGAAEGLVAGITRAGLEIDTLINNAGYGARGAFADLPRDSQLGQIDLNCRALVALSHAVLPAMIAAKRGAILNVASTAAFQPGPWMAVYYATKAFVLSFSEALHEELRPHDIKVTALCPGPTATEFGKVAGFGGNGVFDRLSADAPSVVRLGLKALQRNRAVAIPGLMNKASAQGHRLLPRMLVRKAAGLIKL